MKKECLREDSLFNIIQAECVGVKDRDPKSLCNIFHNSSNKVEEAVLPCESKGETETEVWKE